MADRAEDLDLDSCKQFARNLFGLQQTPFYMLQYKFAEKTATLAKDMYLSRNDMEYIGATPATTRMHEADVIEAAGILSNTVQYGSTNYDDVANVASTEVAEYLQYVNSNKNESLFRSTYSLLSQLCVCNNMQMFGPILIVLARALITVEAVGESPNSLLGNNSASYAAQLWSTYHTILELKRAGVHEWSDYTTHLLARALPVIKKWQQNELISSINFKGAVNWKLDRTVMINGVRVKPGEF